MFLLAQTMMTSPLYVTADDDTKARLAHNLVLQGEKESVKKAAGLLPLDSERERQERVRICTTCLVDRSLASTHCGNCGHCIASIDHHCPYVNNCVGRGRLPKFLFSFFLNDLYYFTTLLLYYFTTLLPPLISHLSFSFLC